MTKKNKLHQGFFILAAAFSISACSSGPEPVADVPANEPIIVGSDQVSEPYEPAPSERYNEPYEPPVEPGMDTAMMEESSGVAAPADDSSIIEPMDTEPMPEPAMEPEPEPEPAMAGSIGDIPADYYGIQIVASSSMDKLQVFAAQHGISDKLSTKIVVDGKEWYILLHGSYATLEQAKAELANIQGQYSTSPWIRKISSLQ